MPSRQMEASGAADCFNTHADIWRFQADTLFVDVAETSRQLIYAQEERDSVLDELNALQCANADVAETSRQLMTVQEERDTALDELDTYRQQRDIAVDDCVNATTFGAARMLCWLDSQFVGRTTERRLRQAVQMMQLKWRSHSKVKLQARAGLAKANSMIVQQQSRVGILAWAMAR